MDRKYHIKDHIHWLLWHKIPEFRNLSMDRQGEIVCQIVESEEAIQNIISKGLDLVGLDRDDLVKKAKKLVFDLENEGIPVTNIVSNILSGVHQGLKFLEKELGSIKK